MNDKVLPYLKAYVGLIGAVITALLGIIPPDSPLFQTLTVISAVITAIAVYRVPNLDPEAEHQEESVQPADKGSDLPSGIDEPLDFGTDENPMTREQWQDPAVRRVTRPPYGGEHEA